MIGYNLFFDQNLIHDRWHTRFSDINQVRFYHRDLSCPLCNPPEVNTQQFDNFWDWYSRENPVTSYTVNTQRALEDLYNAISPHDIWEAVYSIIFTIRYSSEPRPYTELRQEIYNASTLTDTFIRRFPELIISEPNDSDPDFTSEPEEDELSVIIILS